MTLSYSTFDSPDWGCLPPQAKSVKNTIKSKKYFMIYYSFEFVCAILQPNFVTTVYNSDLKLK